MKQEQTKLITISLVMLTLVIVSCLNVSALTISSVDTTPSQIKPGEDAELTVVLENDGDDTVEDVSVILNLEDLPLAPYDSSSEKTVDEIEEDDKQTFRFRVIALNNAKSGIYKIPVDIEYTEDGDEKTRTGLISIIINDKPQLDVLSESTNLVKGRQEEVSIKIINKGLADVEFLEMDVLSGTSYTILSPKQVYIGEIESDDFDTAEFTIFFKETTRNFVDLPVQIKYRDITNKQYIENYNVELRVYDTKEAIQLGLIQQSRTGMYVGIVVLLVIVFIVYRWIRRRRKARKAREAAAAS